MSILLRSVICLEHFRLQIISAVNLSFHKIVQIAFLFPPDEIMTASEIKEDSLPKRKWICQKETSCSPAWNLNNPFFKSFWLLQAPTDFGLPFGAFFFCDSGDNESTIETFSSTVMNRSFHCGRLWAVYLAVLDWLHFPKKRDTLPPKIWEIIEQNF